MDALPHGVAAKTGEHPTRLSCPDCSGVLTVHAEGTYHHLVLTCRVGHQFSVRDLLIAKEERLEERLWEALHGLEELAGLLGDLCVYATRGGIEHICPVFAERAERAHADAVALRTIIENNRAVALDDDVALIRGGGGPP